MSILLSILLLFAGFIPQSACDLSNVCPSGIVPSVLHTSNGGVDGGSSAALTTNAQTTTLHDALVCLVRINTGGGATGVTDTGLDSFVSITSVYGESGAASAQLWESYNIAATTSNVVVAAITTATTYSSTFCWELTNVLYLSDPKDVVTGTQATTGSPITSPSFTPSQAQDLCVAGVSTANVNQTFAANASPAWHLDSAGYPTAGPCSQPGCAYNGSESIVNPATSGQTTSMSWNQTGANSAIAVGCFKVL